LIYWFIQPVYFFRPRLMADGGLCGRGRAGFTPEQTKSCGLKPISFWSWLVSSGD